MFMFHLTHWHSPIFKSIKSGLIRKNKANKWVTKINTSIGWKWKTKFGFISRKNVKEEQKFTFEKKRSILQIFCVLYWFSNPLSYLKIGAQCFGFSFFLFFVCLFFSLTVVVFFSTNFKIPFVVNSCTSFLQSNERNRSMKTSFHM